MPAIILEGPDGSGKTTLGHALKAIIPESHYWKSPAGVIKSWRSDWNKYASLMANRDTMSVLDRTPEISEAVYSTAGGREPRGFDLIESWYRIANHQGIFLVFCWPQSTPGPGHYDVMDRPVHHQSVMTLYRMTADLFQMASRGERNVTVHEYRWWDQQTFSELLFRLGVWADRLDFQTRAPIDTMETSSILLAEKGRRMIGQG